MITPIIPLTKKYIINGPNNVIRLTNNKNKVLYIFGDYHLTISNQNECFYNTKYDSLDIDKFLLSFIKSTDKIKYDIFTEMYHDTYADYDTNYKNKYLNYRRRYIDNVDKLFQSNIKDKYKNIRFHYTDIRENLLLYNRLISFTNINIINKNYTGRVYILLYKELKELIKLFIKLLDKNKNKNKIKKNYSNNKIKNKINKIYENIIKHTKYLLSIIDKLINIINNNIYDKSMNIYFYDKNMRRTETKLNVNEEILFYSNEIQWIIDEIGGILIDLYFLRRFLDKKYITNAILYTGSYHMANISYILVKYFNFTITHVNYIKKSIDLNQYILSLSNNNFEYTTKINDLLVKKLDNNVIYQCTNLFNFPDNFS